MSAAGIIDRLTVGGAGGVVAGCTELELLVPPELVGVPYFPTTRLHALAAVDAALGPGRPVAPGGSHRQDHQVLDKRMRS